MLLHYLVKHNMCQSVYNHSNASIERHDKLTVTDKHVTTNAHCFYVCSVSALLGDLLGVSMSVECEFLSVPSYLGFS